MNGCEGMHGNKNATVVPKSIGDTQNDPDLALLCDREPQVQANSRCCSMEGLQELSSRLQGVELKTLVPYDTVVVRTINSEYRIFVLDPEKGRALLANGRPNAEAVEVRVIGSSLGGFNFRTGWIGVGLCLEACSSDRYICTSPVQSLCVEHQTVS